MANRPLTKNLQTVRLAKTWDSNVATKMGEALDSHAQAIGNVAQSLGMDSNGTPTTPAQIGSVNAQHIGGGLLDFAINDSSPRYRAVNYWFEYRQQGNQTWRQVDLGSSRSPHPIVVPNGTIETRAYSQYPHGGPASAPVPGPTVVVTGSMAGDGQLLESTGSGTANSNGSEAGSGAGKNLMSALTGSGRPPTIG